jgi:hypothetical protein
MLASNEGAKSNEHAMLSKMQSPNGAAMIVCPGSLEVAIYRFLHQQKLNSTNVRPTKRREVQTFSEIIEVSTMDGSISARIAGRGAVAGAAGGIAELIWILVCASATGTDTATLARGVTTATGVNLLLRGSPAAFGIAIHMILAVTLGISLSFLWTSISQRWPKQVNPNAVMPIALAGVWAINFLIILPLIDPGFVQIVPYPVSLVSKLLFGVAVAATLSHQRRQSLPILASK